MVKFDSNRGGYHISHQRNIFLYTSFHLLPLAFLNISFNFSRLIPTKIMAYMLQMLCILAKLGNSAVIFRLFGFNKKFLTRFVPGTASCSSALPGQGE